MNASTAPVRVTPLGSFLRERRSRLQLDLATESRRRTPGLRREEVAARAGVSVTWYTWLEQGRGGRASAKVLERVALALELDASGREVLFLLAQDRPPPLSATPPAAVAPALQAVLDSMANSPAYVKTPAWDIVAWNAAATAVLADYAAMAPCERNVLKRLFGNPAVRATLPDWEEIARFAVAAFRVDAARSGGDSKAAAIAAELNATSTDFRRIWADNEARSHGVGLKRIVHPAAGLLVLHSSAFTVDHAAGLSMVVFTPASPADASRLNALLA